MFDKFNYKEYWENNYAANGTSGSGSYGRAAEFKAKVVNKILADNNINSVIEFGCGDGNQLSYMNYKNYIGFDISSSAVNMCKNKFSNDSSKLFLEYNPLTFNSNDYKADLVVSLDVLYHIIEEEDFIKSLDHIFSCSNNMVILYTKLTTSFKREIPTILDRDLFSYLKKYNEFKIIEKIDQKYESSADFLILKKITD